MRASAHLSPRNLARLFPLFFGHQILEEPRPNDVRPLPYEQRPRAFFRFDSLDPRIHRAMRFRRAYPWLLAFHHLRDRPNVLFRRSAASTDEIQPAMVY